MFFVFFFQAEDGIRDLVRSRGLGDVYKRQTLSITFILTNFLVIFPQQSVATIHASCTPNGKLVTTKPVDSSPNTVPVSYTHLTLPTSDLV